MLRMLVHLLLLTVWMFDSCLRLFEVNPVSWCGDIVYDALFGNMIRVIVFGNMICCCCESVI